MLSAVAATARAEIRTTPISYGSGSGATGYDSASFKANYALHACGGALVITTEFVRGSFRWSDTYSLAGKSYPAPSGLSPTVDDQGTFNGTVRVRGGGGVGTFRSIAGIQSGHGCLGDTSHIADLSKLVNTKDKRAIEAFLSTLEVISDQNPVHRNIDIENAIRRKLEDEAREIKRKQDEKRKADEAASKAAEDKRKEDDKRKADEELKRKDDEELKRKDEEERKRKEADEVARKTRDDDTKRKDDERKRKDDEELKRKDEEDKAAETAKQAKQDAAQKVEQEIAAKAAAREAAKKDEEEADRKDHEQRTAQTKWTDADARDTSGSYWPNSRCSYMDDRGFLHPPVGRHRCDPEYMKEVFAIMKRQAEEENARQEAARKAEATRQAIHTMSGGDAQGAAVLGAAAAMAPLVDKLGDGANAINKLFPQSLDLEANARVLLTGGTGHGVSFRAPGFFYVHIGYEAYDAERWSRVQACTVGTGVQLPMTRALTIRMVEIGATIGSKQHLIDRGEAVKGVSVRSGVVYRLAKGFAISGTLGFTSTGGLGVFTDFGVLWRFELAKGGKHMIR